MSVVRIVAIDDHPLFLEGIRTVLEGAPDLQLVATAQDGADWVQLMRKNNPHLVLLDLNVPHLNPGDVLRRGKALFPQVRFVVLTGSRDEAWVRQAAFAGADGYLLKESILTQQFPDQLRRIHAGAKLFDPEVIHALLNLQAVPLTAQEQECLRLMAQGLTNQGIAGELGLSRKRVANVLSGLYEKLDIDGLNESRWVTRVVAVREALSRGLIGVAEGGRSEYR